MLLTHERSRALPEFEASFLDHLGFHNVAGNDNKYQEECLPTYEGASNIPPMCTSEGIILKV